MSVGAVMTVTGPVAPEALGVTDAHNHVWIRPTVPTPGLPILVDAEAIRQDLIAYRLAGGSAIVDCQPGRAGRDARMLERLSRASGVVIVASTGFHLRKYYPADEPLWSLPAEQAAEIFIRELITGVEEAPGDAGEPIRAGFIKIACERTLAATPRPLLEAAAYAAQETEAALEVHTEKGAAAEEVVQFFEDAGVSPRQLVICHMDKRPDFGLHRDLASAGALLEYDTFYRPKYDPERGVWPLLARMVAADLDRSLVLATDIAEREIWCSLGRGPGLPGLLTVIRPRLLKMGISAEKVTGLLGGHIVMRLARRQSTLRPSG